MTRRRFLSLPAMMPLALMRPGGSDAHHFPYEHVIGTSMDLVVWTSNIEAAQRAETAALDEIHRLVAILNTRDSESEIRRAQSPPQGARSHL